MTNQFRNKAISAFVWNAIDRFGNQGMSFIILLILARLVGPDDYGVLAIVMMFINIANVFVDCGLSNALMRKLDRTETDNSTVFYFNILVAFVIYLILFTLSHHISLYLDNIELESIIRYASLIVIINSFGIIQQTNLSFKLLFKTQTKISIISTLVSGSVGIVLAYYGYGTMALIHQQVLFALLRVLLLWILIRWMPTARFSFQSIKGLIGYSSWLLLSEIVSVLRLDIVYFVLGKGVATGQIGYFSYANKMSSFPASLISSVYRKVAFPVFCQLQNSDKLSHYFRQATRCLNFIVVPIMLCLSAVSEPLINLLLDDKWSHTIPLLSILAISLSFWPQIFNNISFLLVNGKSKIRFIVDSLMLLCLVISVLYLSKYGLKYVFYAMLALNITSAVIYAYFTGVVSAYKFLTQLGDLLFIYILSIVAKVIVGFTLPMYTSTPIVDLIISVIIFFMVYISLYCLFKRSMIIDLISSTKRLIREA